MSAKKPRSTPAATPSRRPISSADGKANLRPWHVAALALALGFAWLGYLLLFAAAEMPSLPTAPGQQAPWLRMQIYQAILDPQFLLNHWTGGSWQNVGFTARLWVGMWSLILLASAYAPGRMLLDCLLPHSTLTRLESHTIALALGLQVNSLTMLALGLAGGLPYGFLALTPAVIGWTWLLVQLYRAQKLADPNNPKRKRGTSDSPKRERGSRESGGSFDWPTKVLLGIAIPFVLVIMLGAMLPPHDFDVREYHLQAPKEWYQQGQIDFMPHNVYANMPLGAELQALMAMCLVPTADAWWWGALVGKTVMATFVPLTALALLAAGRRWHSPLAGAVAALIYVSTPWIARTAMKGLNEPAVACYGLLAVVAMCLATSAAAHRWRYAALAGLLAGAAVSCKYPALLFIGLPLAAWPVVSRLVGWALPTKAQTDPEREVSKPESESKTGWAVPSLRLSGIFLLAMLLSCGLWLGKNAVLTGNPTYPLLYEWFGGASRTAALNQQWQAAHGGDLQFDAASASAAAAQVAWRSEWLSPLVVPFALLGLVVGIGQKSLRGLTSLLVVMLLFGMLAWYGMTHRIDRFLVPLLPLACLLGGMGAAWSRAQSWQWVMSMVLGIGLLLSFFTVGTIAPGDSRLLVDLDRLRHRDSLLMDPVHIYLNHSTPPGSKVLLVGDAEPFDLELPVVYNTVFDENLLEQLIRGKSAEQRRAALQQRGITHVYLHWGHIERYRSPGNYGFTDYVTRELIEQELVEEQQVLEAVPEFPDRLYRVVELSE